jgi:cyanate lyase
MSGARVRLTEAVLISKMRENLSWEQIADGTGLGVVFVTAALLGEHALPREAAEKVGKRLRLSDGDIALLQTGTVWSKVLIEGAEANPRQPRQSTERKDDTT